MGAMGTDIANCCIRDADIAHGHYAIMMENDVYCAAPCVWERCRIELFSLSFPAGSSWCISSIRMKRSIQDRSVQITKHSPSPNSSAVFTKCKCTYNAYTEACFVCWPCGSEEANHLEKPWPAVFPDFAREKSIFKKGPKEVTWVFWNLIFKIADQKAHNSVNSEKWDKWG